MDVFLENALFFWLRTSHFMPSFKAMFLVFLKEIGMFNRHHIFLLKPIFRENNIATYFIVPPQNRRKPHLFSTLNARNSSMMTGRKINILKRI